MTQALNPGKDEAHAMTLGPSNAGSIPPRCAENGDSGAQAQNPAQANGGIQNGEPRSSSGECTSGESNTDRPSEGAEKEERRDADVTNQESNLGNADAADLPGSQPSDKSTEPKTTTSDTTGSYQQARCKGEKPKLPRPEGPVNCPRCSSDETKFCYYNNYNIKQPRYFCKGCQRYWTAGGMLRNVPVGAGRRKNKNAAARDKESRGLEAAKQANLATGAYEHFKQFMVDPAQSYSGASSPKAQNSTGSGILSSIPLQASQFTQPSSFGQVKPYNNLDATDHRLSRVDGAVSLPSTSDSYAEDGSLGGRRIRQRKDSQPQQQLSGLSDFSGGAALSGLQPSGLGPDRLMSGDLGFPDSKQTLFPGGFQPFQPYHPPSMDTPFGQGAAGQDWLNMAAAAGQQQAVAAHHHAAQFQQAQQQLQQAAALQAQAQLSVAAAGWPQTQNPYLPGLWPYNLYGAGPNSWAAAAYASRLGASAWGPMDAPGTVTPGTPGGPGAGLPSPVQVPVSTPGPSVSAAPSAFSWGAANPGGWGAPPPTAAMGWGPWGNMQREPSNGSVQQSSQVQQSLHKPTGAGSMISGGSGTSALTNTGGLLAKRLGSRSYDSQA